MANYRHDPQARLDYTWDWGDWLEAGDSIVSYTLTADAGIAYANDEIVESPAGGQAAGAVLAWVTADGGAVGSRLGITCHITTADGREDDRTNYFLLLER